MADWIMRRATVAVREPGETIQPGIDIAMRSPFGTITVRVTARGYANITGRRHPRVTTMHAAYGKRKGQR
jgi:hypothetical protein